MGARLVGLSLEPSLRSRRTMLQVGYQVTESQPKGDTW
jgi:hypothetical protein